MAIKINGSTVIDDSQNFTSTGTISATGNITGGNVSVVGTVTAAGVNTGSSPISTTGNVVGGNINTGGIVSAVGNIVGNYILGNGSQLSGVDATQIINGTSNAKVIGSGGNIAVSIGGTPNVAVYATTGEYITGLISATGNITATGNINSGNLIATGDVSTGTNGTVNTGTVKVGYPFTTNGILYVYGSAGFPDIVLNGADSSIDADGNITGGNIRTAGLISATGSITGASVVGGVMTGTSVSVTGAVTAASTVGGVITGTSLSTTGNVTGGNVNTGGNVTGDWMLPTTGVSTGGNILVGGYMSVVGNLYVANIVSSQTLTVDDPLLYLVANVTYPYNYDIGFYSAFTGGAGNTYQHTGLVRDYTDNTWKLVSNIPEPAGSAFDFTDAIYDAVKVGAFSATSVSATGAVTGATLAGSLTTAAQPNVTSVGTLSSVSISGNVQGGNLRTAGLISATGGITGAGITGTSLTVGTGTITGGNIVNSNANGVGNIGSSTTYFNTVFAKATSAQYADLAEKYTADAEYAPGTVLVFGGTHEVTVNAVDGDRKVAGVVSTNPSYIMNGGLESEHVATVALTGRVPCMVIGPVKKGDLMVSAGLGRARAEADPRVGAVIGKALEDFDGAEGTIEVVVGRF